MDIPDGGAEPREATTGYPDILERVRTSISANHRQELGDILTNPAGSGKLKLLIAKTLGEDPVFFAQADDGLVNRIYEDMAGLGLLTKYIQDPDVEEININRFNSIEVVYGDRTEYLSEGFPTPTAALDVVKRMARMGGYILDATMPEVDSYIGGGTRISAMIPPIIPEEYGVSASIRKQSKAHITKEELLDAKTATVEMLDFLTLCLTHNVSIGIAGGTGSGKTTDQNFLLNAYIEQNTDWNNRIFLIEDTRELNLREFDLHDRPARVIYTVTKGGDAPITMRDLTRYSLRFHPRLVVPVEVRGEEALEAAIVGSSGHTILTSLHAPDAVTAYQRLLFMCMQAKSNHSEKALLERCVAAWPIMCYKDQLRDGSRKYMEIFEATGVKDGAVQGNLLFRFHVEREKREEGIVKEVIGQFEECGYISDKLYRQLRQNGATRDEILHCFPKKKASLSRKGEGKS